MPASHRSAFNADRLALDVPESAHDPIAGGRTHRELSKAHRHPWSSTRNARNQVDLALKKLATIPPDDRDERIRGAERALRGTITALSKADALLASYYGIGAGVAQ